MLDIYTHKARYREFLFDCIQDDLSAKLTLRSESSPYATCFALFGLHLLQQNDFIRENRQRFAELLVDNARRARRELDPTGKPFRQLLAFTLSGLAIVNALREEPLEDLVLEQLPASLKEDLEAHGVFAGKPGSGNYAMFTAVFLLHARDYLGRDTQRGLDDWVRLHIEHMNRFGFWGPDDCMTHLNFQNGYHQYEIFEYLEVENPKLNAAVEGVMSLADPDGHFAPYPGGGGCYDYDAVNVLTLAENPGDELDSLLRKTAGSILAEQTDEGGFCESHKVRPRTPGNLLAAVRRVTDAMGRPRLLRERLRWNLTLQRPKNNRVHTHWSRYSRRWNEADLWDSWFRMLTVARIDAYFNPERVNAWGFVDYPGIGYHHALRRQR